MKNKKQIIKRIGALLCVFVMAISVFCVHDRYLADYPTTDNFLNLERDDFETESDYNLYQKGWTFYIYWRGVEYICKHTSFSTSYFSGYGYCPGFGNYNEFVKQDSGLWKCVANSGTDGRIFNSLDMVYELVGLDFYDEFDYDFLYSDLPDDMIIYTSGVHRYKYSNMKDYQDFFGFVGFSPNYEELVHGKYEPTLGYLQNVKRKVVFDDVPLGENVGETFTERWYYDSLSTTGIDLTSGDYLIRYYQEKWIVTGYGINDVVKKSVRYLLGDFIVQNGYIETYSEDVNSTLAGQGYEEPSFLDLLWNKFVTTHYYFQIVNTSTNEIGGILHVYLTDDNGKFGVEYIGETLDNEGNYDDSGYKDFIDDDSITSDDVEQGFNDLENGENVDFGDVDGVDEFGVSLELFAQEISSVTHGVTALFGAFPPWVLGLFGVAFVLLIVGIIFKVL